MTLTLLYLYNKRKRISRWIQDISSPYLNPKKANKAWELAMNVTLHMAISTNIKQAFLQQPQPKESQMTHVTKISSNTSVTSIEHISELMRTHPTGIIHQWPLTHPRWKKSIKNKCTPMLRASMINFQARTCNFLLGLFRSPPRPWPNNKSPVWSPHMSTWECSRCMVAINPMDKLRYSPNKNLKNKLPLFNRKKNRIKMISLMWRIWKEAWTKSTAQWEAISKSKIWTAWKEKRGRRMNLTWRNWNKIWWDSNKA